MTNTQAITKAILLLNAKRLRDKRFLRYEKVKKDNKIIEGLKAAKKELIALETENKELKALLNEYVKKEGIL